MPDLGVLFPQDYDDVYTCPNCGNDSTTNGLCHSCKREDEANWDDE